MLNKVILMGRLCADPELKTTQSGISVCRFRIAANRPYQKDKEQQADFINITCWRQSAEFVSKYFHKGSMAIVEGSLRNNDYTDQSGVKHYSMMVQADNVSFGESKAASQKQQNAPQQTQSGYSQSYGSKPEVPYTEPQSASQQPHTYQQDVMQPQQAAMLGDLGDFEDILSDGDVPF